MNKLYAIRDVVAGTFDGVFTFRSDADAKRAFCGICSDTGCNYGRYPSDYDFYFIGDFDTSVGSLVPADCPVFLMHGAEVAAMIRGAAVGGLPPEDKPAKPADETSSLPLDFVAPEQGLQDSSK